MAKSKSLYARVRNALVPGRKERRRAAKERARQARFDSPEWRRGEALAGRSYDSYEEYRQHQASKLDADYDRRAEKDAAEVAEFTRRFASLPALADRHTVLCLGARLGAEVRALRALGHFAVGVDLNPGRDNAYVHYGDFHALPFADGSVEAVYSNALDHAFDIRRLMREVHRVLRPDGLFVADVLPGFEEGGVPGNYEATHWRRIDDLLDAIVAEGFERADLRDLGWRGRNHWLQAVLVKHEPRTRESAPARAVAGG